MNDLGRKESPHDTPPLFRSGRAGLSRFSARAFLLTLVLAGALFPAQRIFSQTAPNPSVWNDGVTIARNTTFIDTEFLFAVQTPQTVVFRQTSDPSVWQWIAIHACGDTKVRPPNPTQSIPSNFSNCSLLISGVPTGSPTYTRTFTPTATMIANGGVVFAFRANAGPIGQPRAAWLVKWVPVVGAAITSTNPVSLSESNIDGATVTVKIGTSYAAAGSLDESDFELARAPAGVTVSSAERSSATEAVLTLAYDDGSDFDAAAKLSVRVKASGHSGSGDFTSGEVDVAAVVETTPARPTGLTATAANLSAVLAWTDPSDATLTGWEYRRKLTSASNYGPWTPMTGSGAATASYTVGGLSNSLAYDFQIRAVNSRAPTETSPASATVSATPVAAAAPTSTEWRYGQNIQHFCHNGSFYSVPTTSLLPSATRQTVTFHLRQIYVPFTWPSLELYACPWTSATPAGDTSVRPTGCQKLKNLGESTRSRDWSVNFTPTQAMISNGGVVMLSYCFNSGFALARRIMYAKWLPMTDGASITGTGPATLGEGNLNAATVTVDLTGLTFLAGVAAGDFELSGVPAGVTVSVQSATRLAATDQARLTLSYGGEDYDSDFSLGIKAKASGHTGSADLLAGTVLVDATEETAAITVQSADPLTEANVGGATVTVTLSGETYVTSGFGKEDFELASAPSGVTIGTAARSSATAAVLTLAYDDTDFDSDAKLGVRVLAAGHSGPENLETGEIDVEAVVEALSAPTGFSALAGDGRAGLSWTDPNNAAIEGYEYQRRNSGDGWPGTWTAIPGSGAGTTSYTVTGLSNNQAYDFRIRSTSSKAAASAASATASATPSAMSAAITSQSVDPLTETNVGGATVTVTLTGTTYAAAGSFDKDDFALASAPPGVTIGTAARSSATAAVLTLAYDGTDFDATEKLGVRVKASGHSGAGDLETGEIDVNAVVEEAPGKPSGLRAEPRDRHVVLKWNDPGDSTITGYQYRAFYDGEHSWRAWGAISGSGATTTQYTENLYSNARGVRYQIRALRAKAPPSAASVEVHAHPAAVWAAISSTNPSPLAEANLGGARVTVTLGGTTYVAAGLDKDDFELARAPSGVTISAAARSSGTAAVLTLAYDDTDFDSDARLAVRVLASGHAGSAALVTGDAGVTAAAERVPARPTGFTATAGHLRAVLGWTDPGDSGITGWEYRRKLTSASQWDPWTAITGAAAATTTHAVTGLASGSSYDFQVRAVNSRAPGQGRSAASATASATPFTITASITSTNPSSLGEDNLDGATVTVTLSGATYAAGLDEEDFELASAPSGTTVSAAVRNSATAATLTLEYDGTDFDAAAKLGVRVLATGHSEAEAIATGEVDVAAVAETTPAAPTGLAATARNLGAALGWTDPGNFAVTGYEYSWKLGSESGWGPWTAMAGSGRSTTSYLVVGLSNGLAYDFRIRAVSTRVAGQGKSAASATASATPVAATAPVTSNREWHTPDTNWAVHYDGWAVRTTSLAASAARQTVDFTFFPTNTNTRAQTSTYRYTVLGCPFTSAVINQHETRPRGCETVAGSPINPDFFGHFSGNLTPTRAMIANGGVVFVMWYASGNIVEAMYAKWVPLEGGAAITKTNPSALGEGNLDGATVTVDLSGATFNAGVSVGDFELTGVPAGATVTVASVARSATETDMATLTLSFRGNFDADFSLGVTAKASGHTGTKDQTTGTVRVVATAGLGGLEVVDTTLEIRQGRTFESQRALALSPAFSSDTTNYSVTVPETLEHVRIRPTAERPYAATITVDGTAYGSGYLTGRIKLAAVGTGKTINVVVTPNDPSLSAGTYTYVVTVTREAATITPTATSLDATVGTAITDVTFTAGGAGFSPASWGVDPALPQGLSMDSGTGTISGTPRSAAEAADYTVTATGESSLTALGVERTHRAAATVRIKVDPEVAGAGATISPGTSLTVNEGSTADYTIALTQPPQGGTVTVTPAVSGSSDVTISPASREFTSQNYASAQSFTVTAGSDGDAVDDAAVISHAATGGGYDGAAIDDVTVTVDDDEEVGLRITGTVETDGSHGLAVTEGSTNTYNVALGSAPGSSVTVTPVVPAGTDVSVTPGSLEFDSANWETAKSFTVEAGEDDDTTDDTVKIRHSMSSDDSDYEGKSGPAVTVTVDDDDDFGVTLGGTAVTDGSHGLSVNEDSTGSYTIKLDAEPTGDVTIRPTGGESVSVSVETKSLSFTVNNWSVAQSVTVKAAADGNAVDESVEITHSISGGGYGSVTVPAVTVTAVDDDKSSDNDLKALGISSVTFSPAFSRTRTTYTANVPNSVSRVTVVAVANDGTAEISITPADADTGTRGHQVDLATTAVNTITISVTAQTGGVKDYAVAVTRAKSVTPAGFSFTDATGAEPGAEVTSDEIDVDVEDTGAAIPISVTSGGTLVVDGVDFSGNTVRDGQKVAVKVTASSDFSAAKSATVTIGGVSDEFSVTTRAASGNANLSSIGLSSGALDPAVSADRTAYTVRVGSGVNRIRVTPNTAHAGARVKVSGGHVRSSYAASGTESGDIWFPPRRFNRFAILVTVRAEDGTEKRYTLRVARQGRNAHLTGLVVAAGGGELTLGRSKDGSTVAGFAGRTTAYTVRVPQATTGVEVTPTTTDSRAAVTVNGAAVTRDANGKLGAATVNLPGTSTTVSVVVTPEDAGAPKQTYTVTVEKTTRRVTVAPVSLVVSEGSTATYTVSLEGAPTGTVTVTPASGNTGAATVSGALEFTTSNWNTPQTVTVTGVDDRKDNPASGRGTTVTHTVTGGGYSGAAAATVRVKVTDEAATIAFTNPASLSEDNLDGAVATVDVSGALAFSSGVDENDFELTGVPRGIRVSISEASRDGSDHSRAELTLSYNGADFDSDFSLGVTAKASGHSGTRDLATETVRVAAVVEPPTLSGLEVLGVRGTLSRGVVSESRSALSPSPAFSGETTGYAVTVPATMEHVRIVPTAREPWDVTITVDGTAWGSGNLTGRIKLAAVGTGKRINVVVTPKDPGLSATAYTYVVTVTREAATITPSVTSVDATAGTAITAVTFTSGGAGFSPTGWSVDPALPQGLSMDSGTGRISGTPGRASAAADYTVTATGESSLTALGVERIHRASATVRIKVDPEVALAGATISPGTSLTVNEGSFADYTMALSAQPTGDVTVRLSASGSGDVSIDKSSLTFTMQNYASAQSVRVTAATDGDAVDDAAVISHAATGGGYDGVAIEDVTVTVDDDEELGLKITQTVVTGGSHGLVVTEGSTNTYSVALGSEPASSVTVTPVVPPGTDVRVTPGSLEFDSANWETAKNFTVEAREDDDTTDDTVRIRHSMSGDDSDYNGKSGPVVTVTVDDNDDFGVTLGITPASDGTYGLSVNEDSTASYTIKLDAEPTGDVTIRPTAGQSASISVETKFLSFTVNNWSVAQSVKVKASNDGNAVDESVEIAHSISGGGYGSVAVPAVKVTAVDDDKSSDNDLKALAISSVTLSPAFGRTRTTYTASVGNSVSRVTVVAVANDGTATVSITPADADTGTRGHQVDLVTTAVNNITIRVTAQTGGVKDYAVAVTRAKSVTPAGFSFTDVTGAEPGAEVTSDAIEVDVETGSPAISVTSGGTLVVDGAVFTGNTVSDGQRVAVRLTASSEFSATRSATVTIGGVSDEFSVTTRAASGNANLSSIGLSSGTLDPAVSAERTTYTVRLASSVNRIKATPNTAHAGARVKVNRGSYSAGGTESGDIWLPPFRLNRFAIFITVRAEDGTEKRYTLRVARQNRNAYLSGLVVAAGGGELTLGRLKDGSTVAGFTGREKTYTVRVSQAATAVEVTPTTTDSRATVTVNGAAVARDANGKLGATTVNLPGTSTTVSVVVTPEDTGATKQTYTVTVEKTPRRVIVDPVSLTVGEGSSATYTVSLAGAPSGPVTVTPALTGGDAGAATVSGALTFTTGNWNTPRTVTVTGVDNRLDDPASGRRTTVTHTVTGGGYDGAAAPTVSVRVTDEAALIQSTSPSPLTEENLNGATITVDLAGGLDFSSGVAAGDFELSGVPSGTTVSISGASRDGTNLSRATLTLSYDATDAENDFDSDFSMRVTAKAAGHAGSSDLVTSPVRVTATDETPAARPTGLSARGAPQSAVLTWTNPTDSTITGYQVSRKLSTAPSWGTWAAISGSDSTTVTHTVTSLTNGTRYDFRIRALVLKADPSTASASASATPEAEGASIQSTTPTSLSEANLNGATVTVDLAGGLDFNLGVDKDDFSLSGLPSGVTVSISAASRDATNHYRAALTLSYDATDATDDFDSAFNLGVTAEAAGHTGSSNLSTGTVEVTATAETAAAKPANLRAAVGNAQVVLTWDNPSDALITGYEYQQRDGANWPTAWTTMTSSGATTTTYTATGLTNGTAYHFRIRALRFKAPESAASDSASATPSLQSVAIQSTSPTSLSEANLNGATVTVDLAGGLEFNSDADKDDFELTGLPQGTTVSISTASRDATNLSRAALTLSYDATDAANDFDSDFNLGVKAKASGHTGATDLGTGTVTVTATAEAAAAKPTGLSARGAPQSAVLTWTNPTDSTITGYAVSRKLSTASSWDAWATISGSNASTVTHTVTSLTNGTSYDFRIRALRFKAPESAASDAASATPAALGASIASTSPTSLSEANLNGATVTVDLAGGLDFNSGADKNDFELSGVPSGVTVSISGASRNATNHYRAALTLSYDAASASNDFDSDFNLAVKAKASGHTGSSDFDTGTVEVTATVEAAAAKPTGLSARGGPQSAVLTWTDPTDSTITGYEYQQKTGANWPTGWTTMAGGGATTTTYTVTGLVNNQAYDFRIRALRFKAPESAASDAASATPAALGASIASTSPTSLSEANLNGATVTVDLAGGLDFNSGADKNDFELSGVPSGVTVSISGASRNATNHYRATLTLSYDATSAANDFDSNFNLAVKAKASGHTGSSDFDTGTVEVTATAEAAAAKPTGLSARGRPQSAVLTWTDPTDSTITGYEYQQKTGANWPTGWTTMASSGATTTTYTATGLANGTRYDFRIRALRFKAPESPASDAASATPAPLGASIASTSPSSLSEANLNGATVTVDLAGGLDFNSGADKNDFELSGVPSGVTVSISGASRNATNHYRATLTLSYDATSAANDFDSNFNLAVKAKASGHTGSSDFDTGTVEVTATAEAAAAKPANLRAAVGNAQVVLTWDNPSDSAITGYEYQQRDGANWPTGWTTMTGSGAATTTYTATGLTNGTAYHFRIRALRFKAPESAASDSASATPAPQAASIHSTSPTPLTEANLNGATVTVDLAGGLNFNSDADKDDFELTGLPGGTTVSISTASRDGSNQARAALTLSYDAADAENDFDSDFNLGVKAKASGHTGASDLGTGTVEVTATAEAAAAKPTGLSAREGPRSAVLTWDNPSDSTITGYEYQQRDGANWPTAWTAMTNSVAATTTYTVTGLDNGTAYDFRIRALRFKAPESAASDAASATPAALGASIQSTSPASLTEANLDGATVTVDLAGGLDFNSGVSKDDFELTGVPSGITLSVSAASRDATSHYRAALTLSHSGDFGVSFNLGVRAGAGGHTGSSDLLTGTVAVAATMGVTVSPTSLTIAESGTGNSAKYTVKLDSRPSGQVTITPSAATNVAVTTADPDDKLRFTAQNWNAEQEVTVTAEDDDVDNANDRTATVSHTVEGADYGSVTASNVSVTITDDDTVGVSVSESSVSVNEEGGGADYTVVLTSKPSADVTVTISSGDSSAVQVAKAGETAGGNVTLTFTPSGSGIWSAPQTVTVTAPNDADTASETVTLTQSVGSGSASEYSSENVENVTVNVTDNDVANLLVSRGTDLSLSEGSSSDYSVRLSQQPASNVVVEISSDSPAVTVQSGSAAAAQSVRLTFTQSGAGIWNAAQTVTVAAVPDPDSEDETVRITHSVVDEDSDDGYDGVSDRTFAVNVDDTTPEAPPIAETPEDPGAGEDPGTGGLSVLSVSGGGEVVEGDSATTAQAAFTVSLSPAASLEVSVSYATADGTAEAGSDYESASGTLTFSPGETSRTVTVTVNGDDEAEADETFTLTLASSPNGSIDPQNSSALAVIANDDRKTVDAGMSGEFSVGETTVTVESSLPEDTGLEVVLPPELESGGSDIEELTVTLAPTDAQIDDDLFGYTGNGQDHVLVDIDVSPVPDAAVRVCLPITDGLRSAAGRQRLYIIRFSGGEWEELSSETEDDAVCADVSGFSPFALVFQIDHAKRRVGNVNRAILPELARAVTASTLEAITSRMEDAKTGGGTANALNAQAPPEPEPGHQKPQLRLGELENGETLSLTEAVDGSYYSVSLAGGYDAPPGESEAEPSPAPRSGGLGMWISGDYRSLSGKGGGLADWNGRLISGHLGADYRFGRSFLAGVATSWSHGSFDYTGGGEGSTRVSGDYSSRMNSFHPYLGVFLSERLDLWASAGWGFGEIKMDDGEIPVRQKASARLGTLAAGADLALLGGGASALSLKGEAWISRVKLKNNGDRIEGIRINANRLRAALQGSHALSLGSGSSLVPSLEFGIRRDGGDGETGVGGELAGGVSLASSFGLTLEARGRALLFHQGDAREWGVGGSVTFDPGGDGRGLSMSVLPSWGNGSSGVQGLWDAETAADLGTSASTRNFGLETEVGYGFPALGDRGLLTPYGAFGRPDPDSRNYRFGSRFSLNRALDLTLEGQRRELRAGDPEHELTVQGRLNW